MDGLPPDFLLNFVALIQTLRLSSRKGARVARSSAAWQEIRVARLFRPTYAGANMGHPSRLVWSFRSGSRADCVSIVLRLQKNTSRVPKGRLNIT
jgi:hypothetical protein